MKETTPPFPGVPFWSGEAQVPGQIRYNVVYEDIVSLHGGGVVSKGFTEGCHRSWALRAGG